MPEEIPESEGVWVLVDENPESCNSGGDQTPTPTPQNNTTLFQLLGIGAIGLLGGLMIGGR